MPRFVLNVNRRSQAWTYFEVYKATELPKPVQTELKKLGFEKDTWNYGDESIWCYRLHHSGHTPKQWKVAIQLMSIGYNFLNHYEREKCYDGETALMELVVSESTLDYSTESHGSNLTLKILHQE